MVRVKESWFIMFFDKKPEWLQGFGLVKKGYRHVVMTRYVKEYDFFICFECFNGGARASMLSAGEWTLLQRNSTEVLIATSDIDLKRQLMPRLMTCVSTIKHMLGINYPFVFTPWQLRSALLGNGMAKKVRFGQDQSVEETEYAIHKRQENSLSKKEKED